MAEDAESDHFEARPSEHKVTYYLLCIGLAGFCGWLAAGMWTTGQLASAVAMAAIGVGIAASPFAYFHNYRLFIDGDRFGKIDILGVRHSFAISGYAHADWTASRYPFLKFVSSQGRRMFVVNPAAWTTEALIGFVGRVGSAKQRLG